jgi:hypothetical protein
MIFYVKLKNRHFNVFHHVQMFNLSDPYATLKKLISHRIQYLHADHVQYHASLLVYSALFHD